MRTPGCIRLLTDILCYLRIDRQDENERTNERAQGRCYERIGGRVERKK